jgi:hypothetical protein
MNSAPPHTDTMLAATLGSAALAEAPRGDAASEFHRPPRRDSSTGALSRAARWAGLCALFLGTWELAARVEDWATDGASPWRAHSIELLFRPSSVGKEGVPGARFRKWRMNELGFRGPSPAPGRRNVMAFGASETFGVYESPDHEYPRLLEGELNALLGDRYNVVNAALPGMRIGRQPYLERALEITAAAYVVIYPSPANYAGTERPYCRQPTRPIPRALSLSDYARLPSRTEQLLKRLAPARALDAVRELGLWAATRGTPPAERASQATVDAFSFDLECALEAVAAHGAVPVLVTHATWFGEGPGPRDRSKMLAWRRFYPELSEDGLLDLERRANAVARETARRRGALLFDAATELPTGAASFADFVHFNDEGARAMARGVAQEIARHEMRAARER